MKRFLEEKEKGSEICVEEQVGEAEGFRKESGKEFLRESLTIV